MPGQIASGYTDSLTIADLSWWQFYGDSTLRRVIELTLENNKDMLAAAARVEQMRQLYRIYSGYVASSYGMSQVTKYTSINGIAYFTGVTKKTLSVTQIP